MTFVNVEVCPRNLPELEKTDKVTGMTASTGGGHLGRVSRGPGASKVSFFFSRFSMIKIFLSSLFMVLKAAKPYRPNTNSKFAIWSLIEQFLMILLVFDMRSRPFNVYISIQKYIVDLFDIKGAKINHFLHSKNILQLLRNVLIKT